MTRRIAVVPTLLALAVTGCSGLTGDAPDPGPGAARPVSIDAEQAFYSPVDRSALAYGLPTAVSGISLEASPRSITAADERDLAQDQVVKRILVERALGPDVIRIEQREDTYEERPRIAVSAVQFKGLPAQELFAEFVPSVYLLATSTTRDQHNLTMAKPARERQVIAGFEVYTSDWGDFTLVWYPHGDVVYIVLAENPELLVSALRQLPRPDDAG